MHAGKVYEIISLIHADIYLRLFPGPPLVLPLFYSETMRPPLAHVRYRSSHFVVRLYVQTLLCNLVTVYHIHVS